MKGGGSRLSCATRDSRSRSRFCGVHRWDLATSRLHQGETEALTTRFRIIRPWGRALYQIRWQESDAVVSVYNPPLRKQLTHHERMVFRWPDGREYTVVGPNWPDGRLDIVSEEGWICSGQPLGPRRQSLVKGVRSLFEWDCGGQIIVVEGRRLCCRTFPRKLTLRGRGGKRIASWFPRGGGCEGVLHGDLRENVLPVILGMILSGLYDFWGASGA